jgi:hypothetical protein
MLQVGVGALWPRAPRPLLKRVPRLVSGLLGLELAQPFVTEGSRLMHPARPAVALLPS